MHSFILFHSSLLGTGDAKTNPGLDIELTISISSSNTDYPILPINKVICPPPLTSALTIPHCLASFFLPPATFSSTPDLQQKNTHLCLPLLEYGQIQEAMKVSHYTERDCVWERGPRTRAVLCVP